jgi:tRNA (guanine37-N1)-methyltransferase
LSIRFDIISATPQALESRERKIIDVQVHNLRDFAEGKYKQIDDKPYGGGAGMVLMPGPILKAVTRIKRQATRKKVKVIVFSAKGKEFNQKMAYELAKKYDQLVMVSGRYEGIDERVIKALNAEEVSIGRYVLTDGDVAAMVVTSAVARLIPGVIRLESLQEESHWNLLLKKEVEGGGLEYPHYTRPEVLKYKGKVHRVPNILLSGNHKKITDWRSSQK